MEASNKRRRLRAHYSQQRFYGVEHAGDPPERQAGGAETDDLSILRRLVPPDNMHGVGGRRDVIERAIEPLEWLPQISRSRFATHNSQSRITNDRPADRG